MKTETLTPELDSESATDPMLATPVAQRTVAAVLDRHVSERPDSIALTDAVTGRTLTYQELQETAFRIATGLAELGVARQEPVLLMLDNHLDTLTTWAGTAVAGMVSVPINTAFKGESLRHVMANSEARIAIVEHEYLGRIAQVIDEVPRLTTIVVRGKTHVSLDTVEMHDFTKLTDHEPHRPKPPGVADVCSIIYTSGTEGPPKGVLVPHGHAFQTSSSYSFPTTPSDVVLVMLPLFHSGGLFAGVYNALRGGARAVIQPIFSATRFWSEVRSHGCTQTLLMGAMIDFLWRQPAGPGDRDHPLRNVTVIPAMPYMEEFAHRFGLNVTSAYGQSETGTIALTDPGECQPFLCGRPRAFIEMKLVDDDDVEVPQGQAGEIVVRSSEPWSMFLGYHHDSEATVRACRNQWLHTGDAAYQDENGRFIFVDRKRDRLRRRGENVSSGEVEKCLMARSDIEAAAIVAVPSEHLEDDIKAVLILSEGASFDPESILREMVERLPYFMVPRYYESVTEFPLTPTHKVQKAKLREAGVTAATWDCEAHGFVITRQGLKQGRSS